MKLSDIKEGDYLYYTERPYSNYADSLIEVKKIGNYLYAKTLTINFNMRYILHPNESELDWKIEEFFDEKCWWPTTYQPSDGDPSEWMKENYPLNNSIPKDKVYALFKTEKEYPYDASLIGIYTNEYTVEVIVKTNKNNEKYTYYFQPYYLNHLEE